MLLWGLRSMIGHVKWSLLITGGGTLGNYELFNYLSDFAETRLRGVYMSQDDTCEIISQPYHSFDSYGRQCKYSSYICH